MTATDNHNQQPTLKQSQGPASPLARLNNLRIGTKFTIAIGAILIILTILDITHNARKEQHIVNESLERWTALVADTVRISLNTLMRENKMDMRFTLFESMSKELTQLKDIRIIRGPRTDETFLEANQKEVIPRLQQNREAIQGEIQALKEALTEDMDDEEREGLEEKIQYLTDDLYLIDNEILAAGMMKETDPRERPRDSLDLEVLKTGKTIYKFEDDSARVLIPYTADRSTCGKDTGCHKYANDGDVLGAISMEFSTKEISEEIWSNNLMLAGFWAIRFLIFLIVVSLLLRFIITHNLKQMLRHFAQIASGNLTIRAPVLSNDELGQLAHGFNQMADTLDQTTVSKAYVDNIIRNMMDILVIISPDDKIVRLNAPTCELLGYSEDELIGQPIETIFTLHKANHVALLETGEINNLEGTFFSKSGNVVPVIFSASVMRDANGDLDGIICVAKDITEKKESQEKLAQLTHYDGLTGLFNRTRLIEILSKRLSHIETLNEKGALLIVDLDDFMAINDRYGHKIGDTFIKHIASLLRNSTSEFLKHQNIFNEGAIAIARLGADEFAILLPDANDASALKLAEAIRETIANQQNLLFDEPSKETVSIGISLYPEHATTASALLTKADTAMFRAKEMGGNQTHIFSQEEGDHTVFHARRKWREKINNALREDRFELWYQPILNLTNNQIQHYEALVRMRNQDGTIVMPGSFIGIAERYNMINEIDKVVSEKAIRFQATNSAAGRSLSFSINLSGKDLENEQFLSFLRQAIDSSGANPENIIFEITETEAVRDLEKAKDFIKSLKQLGCKFSLDDFGVGFTSFLYLKEMQVDYIKIDGCFIKKLNENSKDQLFVKAIVDVASGLGIKTVAEFVENKETLELLRSMGVNYAQGYLIGKPSAKLLSP
jgi:diguanylate cyclase (GGDEF)-like protein/PAS domain S-box-containing protein